MAAVSYSINRGAGGFKISDFTHGTLAPNANDIELRVNTTDGNGAAMHPVDIVKALTQIQAAILSEAFFGSDWGV
jgi:hypothetical protein